MSSHGHPVDPGGARPLLVDTRRQAWRIMRSSVANPIYPATLRRDLPYFTDRVCVERRVSRPRRPDNPCPQIVPPSCKPIVFLLPFALCAAFPRSDYYGSSALGVVHLRSSRLARFGAGQTIRVPVFRSPTFVPLGGELYPWRYWRRAERAVPVSDAMPASSSRRTEPCRFSIALPPMPSRDLEAVIG